MSTPNDRHRTTLPCPGEGRSSAWSRVFCRIANRTWLRVKRRALILVIMGVVGVGKTTVATLLAQKLGWKFADADEFHSPGNVEKIRHGIPLTDWDRAPWLAGLRAAVEKWNESGTSVVLACSALKQSYREELSAGNVS